MHPILAWARTQQHFAQSGISLSNTNVHPMMDVIRASDTMPW